MNKNILSEIRRAAAGLFALTAMICLVACGDNDEPQANTDKEAYDRIAAVILDAGGTPYASATGAGERAVAVGSALEAHEFCEAVIGTDWDGKDLTVNLGRYGTVRLHPSATEGVYNTVDFNLIDITPHTLTLASREYLDNDNSAWSGVFGSMTTLVYKCEKCGKTWNSMTAGNAGLHAILEGCDGKIVKL